MIFFRPLGYTLYYCLCNVNYKDKNLLIGQKRLIGNIIIYGNI